MNLKLFFVMFVLNFTFIASSLQKLKPKPQIIQITDDVKIAVGFGFSNMILIEGFVFYNEMICLLSFIHSLNHFRK